MTRTLLLAVSLSLCGCKSLYNLVRGEQVLSQPLHHRQRPGRPGRLARRRRHGADALQPHAVSASLQERLGVDWKSLSAAFYEFDPARMWQMFAFGAAVMHQRCAEVNQTLGWHLFEKGAGGCGTEDELLAALEAVRDAARVCAQNRKKAEVCRKSDVITFEPSPVPAHCKGGSGAPVQLAAD